MRRLLVVLPLLLSACASPDPGQRVVGDTGIGAGAGCAMGALATVWTGPGALAGCGIGAAMGAAGGMVAGTASAAQMPPPPPPPQIAQPYYGYPAW